MENRIAKILTQNIDCQRIDRDGYHNSYMSAISVTDISRKPVTIQNWE